MSAGTPRGSLRPPAAFIAVTLLNLLKPRLKRRLRPFAAWLAGHGVTANQVTVASLIGSLAVGAALSIFADHPALFGLLPAWLLVRLGCATIDGTLAIDFGQKSRLGGFLNEVGDIFSDGALILPLAFVAPFVPIWVAIVIGLTALCEIVGIAGPLMGRSRRLEGPFGKVDRALVLGTIGGWICFGPLPAQAAWLMPGFSALLVLTIVNRARFAAAEAGSPELKPNRE
jgi:CDP-diacylglycerol--glycerol-3-phosphate 3-phosphatidyltransferase